MDAKYWEAEGRTDARHDWRWRNSKLHREKPWCSRFRQFESTPIFTKDPARANAYMAGYHAEWAKKMAEAEAARPV